MLAKANLPSVLFGTGVALAVGVTLLAIAVTMGDVGFALRQSGWAVVYAIPSGLIAAIFHYSARRKRRSASH